MEDLFYSEGTVTVTNGSATVTGQGTAWTLFKVVGGTILVGGVTAFIASVLSDNELTLTRDWTGPTSASAPYDISLVRTEAASTVTAARRLAEITDNLAERTAFEADAHPQKDAESTISAVWRFMQRVLFQKADVTQVGSIEVIEPPTGNPYLLVSFGAESFRIAPNGDITLSGSVATGGDGRIASGSAWLENGQLRLGNAQSAFQANTWRLNHIFDGSGFPHTTADQFAAAVFGSFSGASGAFVIRMYDQSTGVGSALVQLADFVFRSNGKAEFNGSTVLTVAELAALPAAAIATTIFARCSTTVGLGQIIAGSSLNVAGSRSDGSHVTGASVGGSYMCLGHGPAGVVTEFRRVSAQ